jgi:NitT/TauT family transport system substrate-binding protein
MKTTGGVGTSSLTRRTLISASAATSTALISMPWIARAQSRDKVTFTLSWVPQASNAYAYIAKSKGFWSKRGIDVDIVRGFGSVPTALAVGEGKFPFGLALSGAIILAAARGSPVACVGIESYKFQMGVAAHPDGGIQEFKDLEGKTVGGVLNSGESPFRRVLAERAGFDLAKVNINNLDISILEQSVMQKQVDAIFCIGLSSLPPMLAAGFKPKFLPAEKFKVDLYGVSLITQQRMVETNPDLCQRFVEGALEGVAYTMANPDECIDIFMREVPEVALAKSGRQFVRSGMEIWIDSLIAEEPKSNGMGWSDDKAVTEAIDLVMKYVAPEGAVRPDAAKLFTNKFAGSIKPTAAQWEAAAKWSESGGRILAGN